MLLPGCGWCAGSWYKGWRFGIDCEQYLTQASNASTVEVAKDRLDRAIGYLEGNGMTRGNTGVIIQTPAKDVGYWYANLVSAREELDDPTIADSSISQTNMLMKLREVLTDNGSQGSHLVLPGPVYYVPNRAAWYWTGWIVFLLAIPGSVLTLFVTFIVLES